MRVSVIVKNWNGCPLLDSCLSSIEDGLAELASEVILVDNKSTDGSVAMVESKYPWVRIIVPTAPVSAPQATNLAMRAASGDFIIHLDNDVELISEHWVKRLLEPVEDDDHIGIVGARIVDVSGTLNHVGGVISPWKIQGVAHIRRWDGRARWTDVDYVAGAVMLMTRSLVNRIGLWDERFAPVYFDDTEYCARARRYGFRVVCNRDVVAMHRISQTVNATRKASERARIYHRNRLLFIKENFGGPGHAVRALIEPLAALQTIGLGTAAAYIMASFSRNRHHSGGAIERMERRS